MRPVELIIKGVNKTRAAFSGIRRSFARMKSWAGGALKGLRSLGRGFAKVAGLAVGMGAAIAAAGAWTVKKFAEQERAVNSLESALKSFGDETESLMPKFKKLASAIQEETGAADENTLQMMAQIRNLGIMPENMEKATKGALGLAKALDRDTSTMARYVALALQGETTMLQRYIPALQLATSEAEKQAIVTDLMARGYKQLKASLNTVSGQWKGLTGNIGDTAEMIGRAISEGLELKTVFAEWSRGIKKFQESEAFDKIRERIKGMLQDARALLSILSTSSESRDKALLIMGDILKLSLVVGAEKAVEVLKGAATVIGELIGDAAASKLNPIVAKGSEAAIDSLKGKETRRRFERWEESDEGQKLLKEGTPLEIQLGKRDAAIRIQQGLEREQRFTPEGATRAKENAVDYATERRFEKWKESDENQKIEQKIRSESSDEEVMNRREEAKKDIRRVVEEAIGSASVTPGPTKSEGTLGDKITELDALITQEKEKEVPKPDPIADKPDTIADKPGPVADKPDLAKSARQSVGLGDIFESFYGQQEQRSEELELARRTAEAVEEMVRVAASDKQGGMKGG